MRPPIVLRVHCGAPFFPQQEQRDARLRAKLGDIEIREWKAPDDPQDLFRELRNTVFPEGEAAAAVQATTCVNGLVVLIEIGSTDRTFIAAIAVASALAVTGNLPVVVPRFRHGDDAPVPGPAIETPKGRVDLQGANIQIPEGAQFRTFALVTSVTANTTTFQRGDAARLLTA